MILAIFQVAAIFCCGAFFGAALYISLVQHPATLETGGSFGGEFFPRMYKRAAPLQITLAIVGFVCGVVAWFYGAGRLWLVGALFLISVIPITLVFLKPGNDKLLNPENDPASAQTRMLLESWGPKHALRTAVSGVAFVLYVIAGA